MTKTTETMSYTTKVILLSALAILIGYLLTSSQSPKTVQVDTFPTSDNIQEDNGLSQAQDELDTINVDSVDSGLNQLNTESNSF